MEVIRTIKITVCIDTNKMTYQQEFDNIEYANSYLETILEQI